jgi:hypothetical protein
MEHVKNIIREILSKYKQGEDKCNCGCHTCENVGNPGVLINESLGKRINLSENLQYHVDNKLPLTENTFRYGSKSFLDLWAEARYLYLREAIHVNDDDKEILTETNLGEYGMYEGVEVPLDLPIAEMEDMTLPVNAYEIPLQDILARIVDNGDKDTLLYKDLENLYKRGDITPQEIIDILRDNGAYYEYMDLLNLNEAKEKKKNPPLGKPKRGGSGGKKYYVYVKNPKTKKIKKVSFGDAGGLRSKINDPKARQAFAKRHNCANKKDRTKASYWSCRLPRYAKLLGFKTTFSGFW